MNNQATLEKLSATLRDMVRIGAHIEIDHRAGVVEFRDDLGLVATLSGVNARQFVESSEDFARRYDVMEFEAQLFLVHGFI